MNNDLSTLATLIDNAGKWDGLEWDGIRAALPTAAKVAGGGARVAEEARVWLGDHGQRVAAHSALRMLDEALKAFDVDSEEDAGGVWGLLAECEALADAEEAEVEAEADKARELGAQAIEAAREGNLDEAVNLLEMAATIERAYGDDPSWGPALREARRLAEESDSE